MPRHMVARAGLLFLLLIATYLLLGWVAFLVPDWRVQHQVSQTRYIGDLLHDDYPKAILFDDLHAQDRYTLDNFTDALMVDQALSLRSEGLKGILLLPRYEWPGATMCDNIGHLLAGDDGGRRVFYGRYWHGSTFVARILLATMNFLELRYLLYVLSSLLGLWCLVRLWRKASPLAALSLALALLAVGVYVMQFSLQFAPVLLIALAAIVWMTYRPAMSTAQGGLLFFAVGSLTAYFDLITVPSLSLGLPLVAWVALRNDDAWRRPILDILVLALWWLAAYLLTWLAKWGLASALTDYNIFSDAYGEADKWSQGGSAYLADAFSSCFAKVQWLYIALPAAVLVVLACLRPRRRWAQAAQFALVALVPLVYYLLMPHPAAHHSWFNYRALAVTLAALLAALASLVDWHRLTHKQ